MIEYDENILKICSICVILATIFLLIGIVTSEIEISKNKAREIYDNSYNEKGR